jgi:hypothetical protein
MDQLENRLADEDPQSVLVTCAHRDDEWVRYLDVQIPFTGGQNIDKRTLLAQLDLALEIAETEVVASRAITKFSGVQGVRALSPGAVTWPHEGLTIHHGETWTRKTGYPRCVQSPAGNRTSGRSPGESE